MVTHPNAPSTERLRSKLSQQLRNLAEGTDSGTVTLTKVGGQVLRDAAISLDALTQENARLREALHRIAAFDDEWASLHVAKTGSYLCFDEPGSVEIARRALNGGTSDAE